MRLLKEHLMRSDNEMPKERQIEARFQKVDSNKKLDLCPV